MSTILNGPVVTSKTTCDRPSLRLGSGQAGPKGMAMVLVATFAWSFAGLFTRSLTIDIPTTVASRSFAGGVLLLAVWLIQRRQHAVRDLLGLRWFDWLAVLLNVVAQGAFSACLFLTSVAHVSVIYALTPFLAAIIAWWWLGERLAASTLAAILVAMAGIVTVVAGSLGRGGLLGDMLALLMTAAFAALIVMPKAYAALRVTETMVIGSFITGALFLPFAHMGGLDLRNAVLVSAYGGINLVLAYYVFLHGARLIPTATAGLIVTLEIVLSPFWVWLFKGEPVYAATVVGGTIVFVAVVGDLLYALRRMPSIGCMLHLGGDDLCASSSAPDDALLP